APATPQVLVREFLAALFGGDGVAPTIVHLDRAPNTMKSVRFVQSRSDAAVIGRMLDEVRSALERLGVASEATRLTSPKAALHSQWCGALEITDGLAFAERIGFRYCAHKTARLTAAAAWWRMKRSVLAQRREVA